jgi:hypothetical protein
MRVGHTRTAGRIGQGARCLETEGKEAAWGTSTGNLCTWSRWCSDRRHAAVLVFPILALAIAVTVFGFRGVGLLVTLLWPGWPSESANDGVSEFGVTNRAHPDEEATSRKTLDTP